MNRTFDRLPSQNARRLSMFSIAENVEPKPLRGYTWQCGVQLDQGSEGACVGFGWAHELAARPAVVLGINNSVGYNLYREFQRNDEWAGEDYDGTSVDAGAKMIKSHGFMDSYVWANNLNDILLAVGYKGPVVMGTNWYDGMWEIDSAGFLTPTGSVVGGHCWLVRGVSVTRKEVLCRNSWGPEWGLYGDFRLTWSSLEKLLTNEGEACLPLGRDKVGTLPT